MDKLNIKLWILRTPERLMGSGGTLAVGGTVGGGAPTTGGGATGGGPPADRTLVAGGEGLGAAMGGAFALKGASCHVIPFTLQ